MDPRRARDPRLANRADPRLAQSTHSNSPAPVVQSGSVTPADAQLSAQTKSSSNGTTRLKGKPLFCVVCASNQVCSFVIVVCHTARQIAFFLEPFDGRTQCACVGVTEVFSSQQFLLTSPAVGKLDTESYRLEPVRPSVYLAPPLTNRTFMRLEHRIIKCTRI